MVFGVVVVVVAVAGIAVARVVSMWWAGQPLGIVRIDGRVELGVGARQVDTAGQCGDSGELRLHGGRLELRVGADHLVSAPAADVVTALCAVPRPSLRITGDGWALLVVVDRARPVPVLIGAIGRRRQATMAEVVANAVADAATEANPAVAGPSPSETEEPEPGRVGP